MDLILWRHAEAEEGSGTVPDKKRRLTARGEKQAQQVARVAALANRIGQIRPRLNPSATGDGRGVAELDRRFS